MVRRLLIGSFALALVGCGGSSASPAPTSTSVAATTSVATTATGDSTTTTVAAPVATYPLTGLPADDPAAAARPALVVKIDNNPAARPQSNLAAADIVFEEIVEAQTRFAAVFQSQGQGSVGPIRSGRTQDVLLLGSLNKPLFAWSGGNAFVTHVISQSDFIDLSAQKLTSYKGGGFYRATDRKAPHNLYAKLEKLWSLAPAGAAAPPPQFEYLATGQADSGGTAASGTKGEMFGLKVQWSFDAASGTYARRSGGVVHSDALLGPLTTENVLVIECEYRTSAADRHSPEAQTIGSGKVTLYSRGKAFVGTWKRADRVSVFTLTNSDGTPMLLSPGRTFVELARPGTFNSLP
jgi:hypothetical protein